MAEPEIYIHTQSHHGHICEAKGLRYLTVGRFGARVPPGHSEHSRNAFRAEPFRTFRSPWQPSVHTHTKTKRTRAGPGGPSTKDSDAGCEVFNPRIHDGPPVSKGVTWPGSVRSYARLGLGVGAWVVGPRGCWLGLVEWLGTFFEAIIQLSLWRLPV